MLTETELLRRVAIDVERRRELMVDTEKYIKKAKKRADLPKKPVLKRTKPLV